MPIDKGCFLLAAQRDLLGAGTVNVKVSMPGLVTDGAALQARFLLEQR